MQFGITSAQGQNSTIYEAFSGTWVDTVKVRTGEIRFAFHIDNTDEDTLKGYLWSPDTFPPDHLTRVSHILVKDDSLKLKMNTNGARFAGALSAKGNAIEGKYMQSGQTFTLTLSPAGKSISMPQAPPMRHQQPEAVPADVKSPEAVVKALFDAYSAPGNEKPEWDRARSLFLPEARLVYAADPAEGNPHYEVGTVNEFINTTGRIMEGRDFREEVVHTVTERHDNIAHVFFSYEGREPADAPEPMFRGIESALLWYDGDRWWIVNVLWQSEREDAPIPNRYLGKE